jgi:hypothetical protein
MADITVLTCVINSYDNLRPPQFVNPSKRYLCYLNDPWPATPPWEYSPAYTPYPSQGRNSRIPKILSHLHCDTEYSIYHDACFRMAVDPEEAVERWLKDSDMALLRHPCRQDVYEEAALCLREGIGDPDEINRQTEAYRAAGLPPRSGLWAGGILVRRHTPEVIRFNELWWEEFLHGCSRDQIALPYAIWKSGIAVHTIDADIFTNPWWAWHWHAGFAGRGDNPEFVDTRRKIEQRWHELMRLCK